MITDVHTQLSPDDIACLPEEVVSYIKALESEMSRITAENNLMLEEIRLLRARRFAPSSEKSAYLANQQMLFNEAEYIFRKDIPEPDVEEVTVRRVKQSGKRETDLSGLPIRRIDYELDEDERICPECEGILHKVDVDIRREIEYIPATVEVIEHATHIYGCRHCQVSSDSTPIISAVSPKALFRGSLVTPSLLAQIITDKYLYHLPLYRQERALAADGLTLSRQTMSNWLVQSSEQLLGVVYEQMKQKLLQGSLIHADETTVQVLREDNRQAQNKSYMWLYRSGSDATHPLVLYEYQPSRSHRCPKDFLSGYSGFLQSDGYKAYQMLGDDIKVVCCWAHVRRKFTEAYEAVEDSKRAGSTAETAIQLVNRLFAYERQFADMGATERKAARMEMSLPVAEELFAWAESVSVLPKAKLGKAIAYMRSIKSYLLEVFSDGRLELSNNRAERSIKPFVLGRKNWLFSNTPRGADTSAVLFSIVETARENRLLVYEYFKYLFEQLPNITTSDLGSIMPWSDTLPDHVKVPTAY